MNVQEQVLNELHWDLAIPRGRVSAKVEDGWVTLSGQVERAYQRSCAEADVRRVYGVVGVRNQISISTPEEQVQH
jgi:osmotically-inducible protein OsmY